MATITDMSDILADYREWRSQQEERIGTHSPECHLWPRHERCMIHRLAAEIERLRLAIRRLAEQDATLSVQGGNVTVTMDATLTRKEREAISRDLTWLQWCKDTNQIGDVGRRDIKTLRGLLERLK